MPEIVFPYARRTQRVAELSISSATVRPGGRREINEASGMPVSEGTILRYLKRQLARLRAKTTVRVAGIDDWGWRKGRT